MKRMYCWRCGSEFPMLDEEEFAIVDSLLARAVRRIKEAVRFQEPASRETFILEQYRPLLEAYHRITGEAFPLHPLHLYHHRISKYGPPCHQCRKPLRTPRAKHCAACGAMRATES
jgi:hypothetical protein